MTEVKTSASHPLIIAETTTSVGGLIGMTLCPGKKQENAYSGSWDRDLALDLASIHAWGATAVVTLMETQELERLRVTPLGSRVQDFGMEWYHLPIQDQDIPALGFERSWTYAGLRLRRILTSKGRILVHCLGGLGRTGTLTARLLVELGEAPESAIRKVRATRPGAIENARQEAYVRSIRSISPAADTWTDRILGCLIGGALGDGFGYAVEFDPLDAIRRRYGAAGLRQPVYGRDGRLIVSDDTQMTLFTLEGLLRAVRADGTWQDNEVMTEVRRAYLDWFDTQHGDRPGEALAGPLARSPTMRVQQAPGMTCLSALAAGGHGSIAAPKNDSKGCGAAMRSAPIGFLPGVSPEKAYQLGAQTGAITHGHPDGWGSAGIVAAATCRALQGAPLLEALRGAVSDLDSIDGPAQPTRHPYQLALELAERLPDDPQVGIRELGQGWVGEEAVAIGAYAALTGADFADVMVRAANHDGDSDSTASIAGQLWGACFGVHGMPHGWIQHLDVLQELFGLAHAAANLAAYSVGPELAAS